MDAANKAASSTSTSAMTSVAAYTLAAVGVLITTRDREPTMAFGVLDGGCWADVHAATASDARGGTTSDLAAAAAVTSAVSSGMAMPPAAVPAGGAVEGASQRS